MCGSNGMLIVFVILKIILLFIVPIIVFILYRRKSRLYNIVGIIDILCIVLLIVLRLFENECISNSNIKYIQSNRDDKVIYEDSYNSSNSIYTDEAYSLEEIDTTNDNSVFVYNINVLPLKKSTLMCDKKSFMSNYGNSITGVTILMSNAYNSDFDENEVLQRLVDSPSIDCNKGVNFDGMFNELAYSYGFTIHEIRYFDIDSYILRGQSVLAETINEPDEEYNFGCGKDYIVIYNKTNNGYYNIINPNDKPYSYFCPSNTTGYGSIIDANQNNNNYTFEEINSKTIRYFVIGVE